jgi:outer membrane biosynthesis protein TonB
MYFDFDDYRPDISRIGTAISWREGVLLSIIAHLAAVIVLLLWPRIFPYDPSRVSALPLPLPADQQTPPRFVYVNPKVDLRALKPPNRAELSDIDRQARAREQARNPTNPLPFSRGNSPERVEAREQQAARGQGPEPDPAVGQQARAEPSSPPTPEDASPQLPKLQDTPSTLQLPSNRTQNTARSSGGSLGDALRNLQRYIETDQFENQRGGTSSFGPEIQFDTKGVEFGPWIRRFVAQVKRNWEPLIPQAAMMFKGHVVITFNVHKSGALTDITIVQPSTIGAFNTAAYGGLVSSNPTVPLPPEYPADKAFFTVTFFYNEEPQ